MFHREKGFYVSLACAALAVVALGAVCYKVASPGRRQAVGCVGRVKSTGADGYDLGPGDGKTADGKTKCHA